MKIPGQEQPIKERTGQKELEAAKAEFLEACAAFAEIATLKHLYIMRGIILGLKERTPAEIGKDLGQR